MTEGEVEVIGSGLFSQKLNRNWIYERFYVAKHVSSIVELFERIVDNNYSSIGTLPGDSGACVTTKEGAIHSFVIGKTSGPEQFRLLSSAHFVLEQIKTLTDKENVKFVKCERKTNVISNLQSFAAESLKIFS
jgi:hypothetical protein